MDLDLITQLIQSPTEDAINALFDNGDTAFLVDWREEDDAIVEYCEEVLRSGSLSADLVESEAGVEMYINYQDRRVRVPLVDGPEDRHITLVTLNEVLRPDYEIRFCIDSNGSDTLAFVPLPTDVWQDLETRYGDAVAKRFYRLERQPNVFTDRLPF